MGFDSFYEMTVRKSEENKLPKRESTILPFFGFEYERDYESQTYGGGYSITESRSGGYEIQKNRTYVDLTAFSVVRFYRDKEPKGKEKELEDKIYDYLKRKYRKKLLYSYDFDPFATPYFYQSAYDFYYGTGQHQSLANIILSYFTVVSIAASIITFIIGAFINNSDMIVWSLVVGIACFVVGGILLGIFDSIDKKKNPYDELSESEREKVKQKYLNSLTVGEKDIDGYLREYARLKSYI